jgi:hypothetical protein
MQDEDWVGALGDEEASVARATLQRAERFTSGTEKHR